MSRVVPLVPAEELGVSWLGSQAGPGRRVTNEAPDPSRIDAALPLWLVTASPSTSRNDGIHADPRLDVETFAPHSPGRSAMWAEAQAAHDAMRLLGFGAVVPLYDEEGAIVRQVLIDGVTVVSDPVYRFWSSAVDRAVAVYELHLRAQQ
jgi:hypothetical protein